MYKLNRFTLQAIIILLALFVGMFVFYPHYFTKPQASLGVTGYSFQVIDKGDIEDPNYVLDVYNNQKLIKELAIDSQSETDIISLSPDQRYVALVGTHSEGGCLFRDFPIVIDLKDFSTVNIDSSVLHENEAKILGVNPGKIRGEYKALEIIKSMNWISNNQVSVVMQFGEKDACPLSRNSKLANPKTETERTIPFTISQVEQ